MGGRGGRRSPSSAATDFDPESLGHVTLRAVRNVCFAVFVLGVVIFTVIAANYEPDDPLLHPSSRITSFLTSASNATFHTEGAVTRTGEDFIPANASSSSADAKTSEPFLTTTDMDASGEEETTAEVDAIATAGRTAEATDCDPSKPIECRMPEVYHLMMRAAMETFKDVHFYKFGKPSPGGNDTTCDMAWRFQPKNPKTPSFYKDYRRFLIRRAADCSHAVLSIGEYHSGVNARKRKKGMAAKNDSENGATTASGSSSAVPLVGDDALVDDLLPVVKSDDVFTKGKYLDADTSGEKLLATLKEKGVKDGRNLFIATNEAEPGFFEPLRDMYKIYLLGDFIFYKS